MFRCPVRAALAAVVLLLAAAPAAAQVVPPPPPPPTEPTQPRRPPPTRPRPAESPRPRPAAGDTARGGAAAGTDTVPERRAERPDSLYDALLRVEGYTPVEYRGDSAEFRGGERVLRLRGDAEVRRAGTQLNAADSIVYREQARFVEAYGEPRATGQGEDLVGEVMFYDLETGRATVRRGRTKITEQATWLVVGDVSTEEQARRIYASDATFTTDDREDPAYHFRAERIKVIRDRILVGRPAVLYFRNVPVMALPFIVQDLKKGRRSGLLTPRFELNDIVRTNGARRGERGTGREISNIGYYWAINDYLGAQLAARWRSESYRAVAGDFNVNWRRQFLNASLNFENFWVQEGPTRLNLNSRASWKPNERTDLGLSLNYAASSEFERDRTVNPGRAVEDLSSNFSMSRRFDWGNLSVTAERRQSLANGDVDMTLPTLGLNLNPITLFPSSDPDGGSFFNNAVLTVGLNGSRSINAPGQGLLDRRAEREQVTLSTSPTLRIRDLSISTSFSYNRTETGALAALDTLTLAPEDREPFRNRDLRALRAGSLARASWSAGTSYQINLIGSTYVSPSISVGQELVRQDSVAPLLYGPDSPFNDVFGGYVASPLRMSFGASANTDLYGFFPGVGPWSAIRHHVKPGISYSYSPAVRPTLEQYYAFGPGAASERNEIRLDLTQTFEGKLKEVEQAGRDSLALPDTLGGDSVRTTGETPTTDPRKVTILSLSTGALAYTFVPTPVSETDLTRRRFLTDDLTNTIRSDYFGGLNFTVGHDLFREVTARGDLDQVQVVRREFSPYLTSLRTSLQFGANSALFRWLGIVRTPDKPVVAADGKSAADSTTAPPPVVPPNQGSFTGNPQGTGSGAWNVSLSYSLSRRRPPGDPVERQRFDGGNQDLSGSVTFFPTANWSVNWNTSYSITDGKFHQHSLNITRNLYRWTANIDFYRTASGNTSFQFKVSLIDLPDLKFDYNESDLGISRPER